MPIFPLNHFGQCTDSWDRCAPLRPPSRLCVSPTTKWNFQFWYAMRVCPIQNDLNQPSTVPPKGVQNCPGGGNISLKDYISSCKTLCVSRVKIKKNPNFFTRLWSDTQPGFGYQESQHWRDGVLRRETSRRLNHAGQWDNWGLDS